MKLLFGVKGVSLLITSFSFGIGAAQNVAINTTGNSADASALFDIGNGNSSTGGDTKGVLIPRVALTDVTIAAPVTSPATGLLVFNSNAAVIGGTGKGYYWWDGTQWGGIGSQGPPGTNGTSIGDWTLVGVANSTRAGNGDFFTTYAMQSGKEYLIVAVHNGTEFTLATTDAVGLYGPMQQNLTAGGIYNEYVALFTPAIAGCNYFSSEGFIRISGKKKNTDTTPISITGNICPMCATCGATVQLKLRGDGILGCTDISVASDYGLYIFER